MIEFSKTLELSMENDTMLNTKNNKHDLILCVFIAFKGKVCFHYSVTRVCVFADCNILGKVIV